MMRSQAALTALLMLAAVSRGETYVCDPRTGSPKGDGSAARPWRTIEEVLADRLIQLTDERGQTCNPQAPVKPGDTLLLRSGWQGTIRIPSGYNAQTITLAAEAGQRPHVGWIEIGEGCNWCVKGLTVSPSLAPVPLGPWPQSLVKLGERGGGSSSNLVVEACFIFSTLDTSAWSAKDWVEKPASGIWLGRHGTSHIARNNYVLNTRFGINLCAAGSVAEGNVVDRFSADGIRITRDGQTVRHNVIKNIFVSAEDGDDNHDDGIQAFLFGAGKGRVKDVTVRENIILAREQDDLPFPAPMQGIGFFDGPLENFTVDGNVVCVNTWHGLTLNDAQACTVSNNVVYGRWEGRGQPWLMLGAKQKLAAGNTVRDNLVKNGVHLKHDAEVRAGNNGDATEEAFLKRQAALLALINACYGAAHPTAMRPRLNEGALR